MTDLRFQGLTKTFGRVTAVRELTLTVTPGVTGFLGPNGAGKTTTLRMLLGLVHPSAGSATIGGRRYADLPHPRRTVGALLDATGLHPGRTGRQHLLIETEAAGLPRTRVAEVLDAVRLGPEQAGRRIRGYSLGMRQRLGLATALLGDPEVLVLDEPGNGLDPAGMAWLRGLLRERALAGGTVLVSSHVLAEVAQTADQVVILGGGTLRYAGALAGLAAGGANLEDAFLRLTGDLEGSTR
jgi:ABC-2 type transport system ATP-binding protein